MIIVVQVPQSTPGKEFPRQPSDLRERISCYFNPLGFEMLYYTAMSLSSFNGCIIFSLFSVPQIIEQLLSILFTEDMVGFFFFVIINNI